MTKRVVVVTGGAGCIGRAILSRFLEAGDTVVAIDIDRSALDELPARLGATHGRLMATCLDVTDEPAVRVELSRLRSELGAIHVLVNNAGGNRTTHLAETTAADWRADVELNLNAAYYVCSAALPGMIEEGRGCVVNIGSINGLSIYGDPGYSAAKAGLIHFTRFLATEYGRRGVRANIVCPGTVATAAWQTMLARRPEILEGARALCSLGDIATPKDVAAAVWFLASEDARMIHGSTLVVDGGLTAGIPSVMSTFTTENV